MKKVRLIVGMTAAIPVAAGGLAAPAAAQATTASAHQVLAMGKTILLHGKRPNILRFGPGWYNLSLPETAFFRNGGSKRLSAGDAVKVTCYYFGGTATGYTDPYWDHFVSYYLAGTRNFVARSGHIADAHVDLDGLPSVRGIPHC